MLTIWICLNLLILDLQELNLRKDQLINLAGKHFKLESVDSKKLTPRDENAKFRASNFKNSQSPSFISEDNNLDGKELHRQCLQYRQVSAKHSAKQKSQKKLSDLKVCSN